MSPVEAFWSREWLAVAILLAVFIWSVIEITKLHKLIPGRNKDCRWPTGEESRRFAQKYGREHHPACLVSVTGGLEGPCDCWPQDRLLPIDDPWRALEIMRRNHRNLEAFREAYREQMTDSGIAADVPDPRTPELIRRFSHAQYRSFRRGVAPLSVFLGRVHGSVSQHSQTGH